MSKTTLFRSLLLISFLLFGCDDKSQEKKKNSELHKNKKGTKHLHAHTAPQGGTLVAFGDEFAHAELKLDPKTGKLNCWILDGEAEKYIRLKVKELQLQIQIPEQEIMNLTLKAMENSLTGEKAGDTSQFGIESKKLIGVQKFTGWFTQIKIKSQEFNETEFSFPEGNEEPKVESEEEHEDHHGHSHGEHDEDH